METHGRSLSSLSSSSCVDAGLWPWPNRLRVPAVSLGSGAGSSPHRCRKNRASVGFRETFFFSPPWRGFPHFSATSSCVLLAVFLRKKKSGNKIHHSRLFSTELSLTSLLELSVEFARERYCFWERSSIVPIGKILSNVVHIVPAIDSRRGEGFGSADTC